MDKFARPYAHLFCVAKMEEGGGLASKQGVKRLGTKARGGWYPDACLHLHLAMDTRYF